MQYLDLVRNCVTAHALKPIPQNVVEKHHVLHRLTVHDYRYAGQDNKWNWKDEQYTEYNDAAKGAERKKRAKKKEKTKAEIAALPGVVGVVPKVAEVEERAGDVNEGDSDENGVGQGSETGDGSAEDGDLGVEGSSGATGEDDGLSTEV